MSDYNPEFTKPKKVYTIPAPRYARKQTFDSEDGGSTIAHNTETTKYMAMLLGQDHIPAAYNVLSSFFTWILLAGFVLLPGTFTTIKEKGPEGRNDAEKWILGAVRNAPLLWVAVFCTGLGSLGMIALWVRWRKNYVWVSTRIFLPGLLNSLAGMISTIVNVLTAQKGVFSTTAIVSIALTSSMVAINAALWGTYHHYLLKKVQEQHYSEFGYVKPQKMKKKNKSSDNVMAQMF